MLKASMLTSVLLIMPIEWVVMTTYLEESFQEKGAARGKVREKDACHRRYFPCMRLPRTTRVRRPRVATVETQG